MNRSNRRKFIQTTGWSIAGTALATAKLARADQPRKRRFTMDLACGRIGVRADPRTAIRLAHKYGFESVEPSARHLSGLTSDELDELLADMQTKNLVWGAGGLPVDFRRDEDRFRSSMRTLPDLATGLQRAGVTRVGTWISPANDQLTYVANFRRHAKRLREAAQALDEYGLRLGLEYVGPKTSWTAKRFPFIHTMAETKDLIAEIGCGNVGFVLDSWHWYTAEEGIEDLLTLTNSDVVACDLNDAPAGLPVAEQIDSKRELPMATGTIDLQSFLGALVRIGYDGPIRAEPFNRELNALPDEEATAKTAAAIRKAFALIES